MTCVFVVVTTLFPSLDGVLSNMRRHKIIEDNMGEKEGEKEAK